jgi:hypothetical protein
MLPYRYDGAGVPWPLRARSRTEYEFAWERAFDFGLHECHIAWILTVKHIAKNIEVVACNRRLTVYH